jgi:hypothetical protein
MSNNKFPSGILTNSGTPMRPPHSFLENVGTGMYLMNKTDLCFAQDGERALAIDNANYTLFRNLKISKGAANGAKLVSNATGVATWKTTSLYNSFQWNSIYKTLDIETQNNEKTIVFDNNMESTPVTVITQESNAAVDNFGLYVKNKSNAGFTVFSNSFMSKSALTQTVDTFASCRLPNGNIGIAYYDLEHDRIKFISRSTTTRTDNFEAITIDDTSAIGPCDIAIVNGAPAIVYVVDNGEADEWRYVAANEATGDTWGSPQTLLTSTTDVTFTQSAVFLRVIDNKPIVFLNNEAGAAKSITGTLGEGISWTSPVSVSNLVNHQILDVTVVDGNPAVIAKSNSVHNIYYVRANNATASAWPVGAIQLYKDVGVSLFTLASSCILGHINGVLSIVATERTTNKLWIAKADGAEGAWNSFSLLASPSTSSTHPRLFQNNDTTYLIYNSYTGSPSEKTLVEFDSVAVPTTSSFISTLNLTADHQVIANESDGNNLLLLASENALTLLKFYGNDLVVNWGASLQT